MGSVTRSPLHHAVTRGLLNETLIIKSNGLRHGLEAERNVALSVNK